MELGEIKSAHGVKGEVKVDVTTDSPKQRFGKTGTKLYLKPPAPKGLLAAGQSEESTALMELTTDGFKVQMLAEGREIWILKFKEIQDRNLAERLRYHVIVLPCAHREDLHDPDEFYAQDLIGCHVFDQANGSYIGKVVELFSGFGTSDTLQLNLRPTKEDFEKARIRTCMIPFVKAMVPLVDKSAKCILVSLPDGLLDLCSSKKMKPVDEDRRQMRLMEISNLEEQEQSRRLLHPVVMDTTSEQLHTDKVAHLGKAPEVTEDEEDEEDEEPTKPKISRTRLQNRRKPLRLRLTK